MFKESVSRRGFLTGRVLDSGGPSTQDRVIEVGAELVALGAIVNVAYQGSQDHLVTYGVNAEHQTGTNPNFDSYIRHLNTVARIAQPVERAADELYKIWSAAYLKTSCIPVMTVDGKGNSSVTLECDTYWDEPDPLTDAGVHSNSIPAWRNSMTEVASRALTGARDLHLSFDFARGTTVFFNDKYVDTNSQLAIALISFGLVGGGFVFYENSIGKLQQEDKIDERYIKRRSVLKLGTALLAAWKIRDLQRAFISENDRLLPRLTAHARQTISQFDVPAEVNFMRYFGVTPAQIRSNLFGVREIADAALNSKYDGRNDSDWDKVKGAITNLRNVSNNSLVDFDKYFDVNLKEDSLMIPEELTAATSSLWATRQIVDNVNSQTTHVGTRHVRDAIFMGVGLAAIGALSELALFPLSDKGREKFEEVYYQYRAQHPLEQ